MRRIEYTAIVAALTAIGVVNLQAFAQTKIVMSQTASVKEGESTEKGPPAPKRGHKVISKLEEPKEPTFTAQGGFLPTKEKARESALLAATEQYTEYLKAQGIDRKPTTSMVRKMIVRHPDASQADPNEKDRVVEETIDVGGSSEKLYRVEVAVRVEEADIRKMRALERSSEGL